MSSLPVPLLALASATPPWMVLPFVLLLLGIATLPLLATKFWEHFFRHISLGLGLLTAAYYLFSGRGPHLVLQSVEEYVSFMALVGSLFVVSGGINIRVKGESTPAVNTLFLFIGAVVANIVGTTGASMLLIRPWIRMNKYRITAHHVAFFIFVVSNVGGSLTPVGDPPLFLGFLRGIPFWWVMQHVWVAWLLALALLLGLFYVIDVRNFHRAPRALQEQHRHEHEHWMFRGLPNLAWLGVVLGAVFIPQHLKVGGEAFSVPVSALTMIAAAILSWMTTPHPVREANDFTFGPVKEVAWLFIGIFLTMRPALDILQSGEALKLTAPAHYYFCSGALSAFLDNAPTYLAFLTAAMGAHGQSVDDTAQVLAFANEHSLFVIAVSLGSVFFGAGSYIGNGPNLMVKAICDHAKVHTPHFFQYIFKYSLPLLIPALVIVSWFVFR